MRRIWIMSVIVSCLTAVGFSACLYHHEPVAPSYQTRHVIVLVVDGPRYQETWGDSVHQYIPHLAGDMASEGVILTNFFNNGYTYTSSGHAAICTGYRQTLENTKGTEPPAYPSFLQCYLKESEAPASKAWLITSKDKLALLSNCEDAEWKDHYRPSTLCGINGQGSGYADDKVTCSRVLDVLQRDQPDVMLVNFKEPDISGHANDWPGYLKGIQISDSLVWEVWKYIQTDPYYKNTTTLFVTNDHGRHSDGWKSGFVNHGDDCEGCRHINLYAYGPDFKKGVILNREYHQIDIPSTIAMLMGFSMPHSEGEIMRELFK